MAMFFVFILLFILALAIVFEFAFKYMLIRFLVPKPCPICGKHTGPMHDHLPGEEQ